MKKTAVLLLSLCAVFILLAAPALGWIYTVKRGDTLFNLARRFGVSTETLRKYNGLRSSALRIGQRINIPSGASPAATRGWIYTVKRGDSLFTIATKTGTTVNALRSANGLRSNAIRIGQRLNIPTSGGRAAISGTGAPTRINIDTYMLARLINAEAGAEPYIGKVAVGAVLLNRMQHPSFPKTLAGVIYQPHAFESVTNGWFYRPPSRESIQAARACANGWDPSGGAIYFFNPAKTNNPFIWSRQIIKRIGKHLFAR
ncbi:MAG: LysM peptidoglycan-binding domain-containing protein [Bacillota bacterium]